jgi:hypothetical protein
MSLTGRPFERLLIQGACKRIAASNVWLPLLVSTTSCAPPMMLVGLECDEPFLVQVVDDPLHVLAVRAQVASEPRHRLWAAGADDGAEDLPAGAREAERRHQPIACGQHQAVDPEQIQDEVGQGVPGCRPPRLSP